MIMMHTGNLDQDPFEWLALLFRSEFCAECGGDAQHHTAIPFNGNWFARCDLPADEDTGAYHPVIQKFRENYHEQAHELRHKKDVSYLRD
jgi:hypothetical protein